MLCMPIPINYRKSLYFWTTCKKDNTGIYVVNSRVISYYPCKYFVDIICISNIRSGYSTKSYTIAFDLLLLWTLLPSNFKDENVF